MTNSESNPDDLKLRIKQVMIEELMLQDSVEDINDEMSLFDPEGLGLDSVDALQLVVGLEKNFGLKIPDAEAAKEILNSVNTITAAIQTMD
ncbi:MAG: acyl carrier protein [Verrucomicrobiota bacterium]